MGLRLPVRMVEKMLKKFRVDRPEIRLAKAKKIVKHVQSDGRRVIGVV
jgi:hypothetical protein